MKPLKVYITIKEYAKIQKAFTYHSLRNLRKHCKVNGFENAFIKVGKKVLIDVDEFYDCIARMKNKEKNKI